jgi:hypothetical protein
MKSERRGPLNVSQRGRRRLSSGRIPSPKISVADGSGIAAEEISTEFTDNEPIIGGGGVQGERGVMRMPRRQCGNSQEADK